MWDKGPDEDGEGQEEEDDERPIVPTVYEFKPCLTFCLCAFDHAKGVALFGALWGLVCLGAAGGCLALMILEKSLPYWSGFTNNVAASAGFMVEV